MGAGVALVVGVKVVVMVENREAAEAVPAEAAVAEAVEGTEQGTARFEVGVGPWEGPWPEGDHWDEELLREGDRRNVVDKYRYWSMDAIIADLDTRRHDFHVAIENWQHDLNIGTVVRTANAMLAKEVHIIGRRRWRRMICRRSVCWFLVRRARVCRRSCMRRLGILCRLSSLGRRVR